MRECARSLAILLVLSGILFFANLGAAGLWDEDEPIFAGAALEMMDRREWIVPYFNSVMLPDKPALLYWVMIGAYRLFGVTEFAARCGPALFSIGTVVLTWLLGRKLFSPAAGLWAGIVLATSVNFDVVARAATPDALLTFFSTLAILCFAWGTRALSSSVGNALCGVSYSRQTSLLALIGSFAAMGMAVLAKGPIGVLLPIATIGLFTLVTLSANELGSLPLAQDGLMAAVRRLVVTFVGFFHPRRVLEAIRCMRLLMGLVIVLAIAGPWYVSVGLQTQGAWLSGFFGKHNLGRFLQPMEHHRGPIFYYLIAIVVGFFPWSLFLGPSAAYVKSQLAGDRTKRDAYRLLICWVIAYVGFFSLAATKLPSYIVPAYPALALLVGACVDGWLNGDFRVPPHLLRTAWVTTLVVGLALGVGLPIVAQELLGGDPLLGLTGLPLILGGAVCWWWHRGGQPRRAAAAFAVTAAAFSLAIFAGGTVEVDRHQNSAQFAEIVHRQTLNQPAVVRSFGYWRPSLVFYLRQPVEQYFADDDIRAFCQAWPARGFLLITGDRYANIQRWLPPDVCVLDRKRWFLRSQDILLLGHAEPSISTTETLAWHRSLNP
jgi:4-amino-4-deoxy-L-arabinose transferase-like glycosyltransferase